jgi:gas vesicle protein
MKEFNTNLNQVSKKTVDTNKRIESQRDDFIKNYDKSLRDSEAAKQAKIQEEVLNNARFSQGSIYARNKNRVKSMQETITYRDRAVKAVLTEYMVRLVESSLLLDTDEYAKLNPNYKAELKETVKSFVEKADLNTDINNKPVLDILEHISKSIPDIKTGIYMEAEDIVASVQKLTPGEVNEKLQELSGDVKERVANLVSKEQGEVNKIQSDIDDIVQVAEDAKAEGSVQGEVPAEEVPVEPTEEELAAAGEMPVEGEEGLVDEMPVEGEEGLVDEMPVEGEEDEYLDYQQSDNQYKPKTTVNIDPSGAVQIKIMENKFYREVPRKGILEGFALNEAIDMVKDGKPYNGELALANALTYITVIEAFNATSLLSITEQDYKRILLTPKK